MKTIFVMAVAVTAMADLSYDSTSQITGGMMLQMANMPMVGGKFKEALKPMTSKTALKDDQLIHRSDRTATIIDVAKETFTTIDFEKKTYSVVSFAEMKAAYEKAMARLSSETKQKQDVKMSMQFDLKDTQKTSTIGGLPCKEVLLQTKTVATDPQTGKAGEFVLNNVMCIAKDVPGSDEYRKFHVKMAEKMNFDPSALQSAQAGFFGQSLSQMQKQASQMDGMPILQYMTAGATADALPTSIEAAEAQAKASADAQAQAPKGPSGKDVMGAAAGSVLGGFGGFGRKKSSPQPSEAPAGQGQAAPVVMQMRVTTTGFSTNAVDTSIFQVPAGFQQVDNDFVKGSK
jgi:hypothetical protein